MLEWKVYYHSDHENRIKEFNIFSHGTFLEDCKKNARKNGKDFYLFCDRLQRDLMYNFWCKCEYEVVIVDWPSGKCEEKVDVYDQVMMNWGVFCKYVWEHGAELRRRERKSGSK